MNKDQERLYTLITDYCDRYVGTLGSKEVVEVMSEVLGWVSMNDRSQQAPNLGKRSQQEVTYV